MKKKTEKLCKFLLYVVIAASVTGMTLSAYQIGRDVGYLEVVKEGLDHGAIGYDLRTGLYFWKGTKEDAQETDKDNR